MSSFWKTALALLVSLLAAPGALAQIPVTDAANLNQQIQQVASWAQQLQQMKAQIEQQRQMFQSLNGVRGLGNLLNDPALKNALPSDWQAVYAKIAAGGYAGLTGDAKALRDAARLYDCQDKAGTALTLCQRELNKAAQDKAYGQQAYASAQARVDQIQNLMTQIDATTDAKAIAELGARLQAENAMIQNEQTKLQLFKMLADTEERLIAQQKHEIDQQRTHRTIRVQNTLTPLSF